MKIISHGKAKTIYEKNQQEVILKFNDDMTAFNGKEHFVYQGKGALNAQICKNLLDRLTNTKIEHHMLAMQGNDELVCRKMQMIPLEFVCRNQVYGSLARKLGLEKLSVAIKPVIEVYYKSDKLDDPLVNDDVITKVLKSVSSEQLAYLKQQTLKINQVLQEVFDKMGIMLIDFKVEFGFDSEGKIYLADEISPDSMRLISKTTHEHYDKEYFRVNKSSPLALYEEILKGLTNVR